VKTGRERLRDIGSHEPSAHLQSAWWVGSVGSSGSQSAFEAHLALCTLHLASSLSQLVEQTDRELVWVSESKSSQLRRVHNTSQVKSSYVTLS
jgi:hypothetical protein